MFRECVVLGVEESGASGARVLAWCAFPRRHDQDALPSVAYERGAHATKDPALHAAVPGTADGNEICGYAACVLEEQL